MPDLTAEAFEMFWSVYPRKTGKGAARTEFTRALTKTTAARIMVAVREQTAAGMFDKEPEYLPHPRTWLHQERYSDEIVCRRAPAFRNGALEALRQMRDEGWVEPIEGALEFPPMIEGPSHG